MGDQHHRKLAVRKRIHELAVIKERAEPAGHRSDLAAHFRANLRRSRNYAGSVTDAYGSIPENPRFEHRCKVPAQSGRKRLGMNGPSTGVEAAARADDRSNLRFEAANPHLIAHVAGFRSRSVLARFASADVAA